MITVPPLVAVVVTGLFVLAAIEDARTTRVSITLGRLATVVAVGGMTLAAISSSRWGGLVQAAIGAALVTLIQLVPYRLQSSKLFGGGRRTPVATGGEERWMGRADVRFGIPFGWTLGWFGVGFVFVGYALSLLSGLIFGVVTRRREVPFIPHLTFGLIAGLGWALARSLASG